MIGERLSQGYFQLSMGDNIAFARSKLKEKPDVVAVLFDDEKRPVTIISAVDLAGILAPDDRSLADVAGQLPPGVITKTTASMDDLVNSPEFIMFSLGARGGIVFDEDRLAGILPAETVAQYLQDVYELESNLRSVAFDTRLAGKIVNNPIILYCDAFNHRNELAYYNRRKPPQCQTQSPHPHPIRQK